MIRVLIVSPVLALRLGLRSIFADQEDIELLGEFQHWENLSTSSTADVIVFALEHAIQALDKEVFEEFETPPALLLLSENAEDVNLVRDLPVRAWGIISSEASEEELLAATRALHQGLLVGSPMFIEAQLSAAGSFQLTEVDELIEELTDREIEVLEALAQGHPNKQIALDLSISEHTVKFHSSAIYAKLGVSNRTEAVRHGVRLGLIAF